MKILKRLLPVVFSVVVTVLTGERVGRLTITEYFKTELDHIGSRCIKDYLFCDQVMDILFCCNQKPESLHYKCLYGHFLALNTHISKVHAGL